jgi:hypothetical protein
MGRYRVVQLKSNPQAMTREYGAAKMDAPSDPHSASLIPIPSSLFPHPYSLIPIPSSLFPPSSPLSAFCVGM